jgi:hypothetical protein
VLAHVLASDVKGVLGGWRGCLVFRWRWRWRWLLLLLLG